jgi:hypothetical protein
MLPVINQSVRDAQAQLHTGHQDIRTYFFDATVAAAAMATTSTTATAMITDKVCTPLIYSTFASSFSMQESARKDVNRHSPLPS